MAGRAVETSTNTTAWQATLVALGALLIVAAGLLQLTISRFHSSTSVVTSADKLTKTTVTGPAAPPTGLVTTVFASGVILVLAGAFFTKISKIVIPGVGELDLDTQKDIVSKVAAATDDPAKARSLVEKTTDNLVTALATTALARPTTGMVDEAFAAAESEVD